MPQGDCRNMKILTLMGLLLATMLLTGLTSFGAQVSIGIRIGPPPPPRAVYVLPPNPGPEYVWVDGYWYPVGNHWKWHKGYWTRAPFMGARWWARVMSAGNTLKVIGKEIAAGSGMTITGTVIEAGTIVRKNGIGSTIAGSNARSRLP